MPVTFRVPEDSGAPSTFGTLLEVAEKVAENLGDFSRTFTGLSLPSGEPGRWVLLDAFKDDEQGRAQLAGGYVYVVSGTQAGASRRIRTEGYEGPWGALGLANVLTLEGVPTNLAQLTPVDVSLPLPVRSVGLMRGTVELVKQASERLYVQARVVLTGDGTHSYPLDAWDWLQHKRQTDGLYDRRWLPSQSPLRRSVAEYDLTFDGPTVTLQTAIPYAEGESFELSVLIPAARLIRADGTWAYSTVGLVDDDDQCPAPTSWLLAVAMAIGLDYLLVANERDATIADALRQVRRNDYARRLATRWGPAAAQIFRQIAPRRDPDPPRQIVGVSGRLTHTYPRRVRA